MLSVKYIRENQEAAAKALAVKNFSETELLSQVVAIDDARIAAQKNLNELQSELNTLSKSIGALYKQNKAAEADAAKERTGAIKEEIKTAEDAMQRAEADIKAILVKIPNLPHSSVPCGLGHEGNIEVKSSGQIAGLQNTTPHWEITKKFDLIDFELGVKIAGAGFPVYKGKAARLQRALINYFLDKAADAGYIEIQPPILVNEDSGFGTGQLPDKEGQMYFVGADNLYLIPTAEVPVTNIYRGETLPESAFPVKNSAYTPCFRREAGSYGADVRGLNRLHQFDKVEIVRLELPENSYAALDEMVQYVEGLVAELGLPYRILRLCGGDMSFHSALTYDFEVYSAGQGRWLEVSSVSNFESFQANRMQLRYKPEGEKKTLFPHTLNGSALALPRIMAALLENSYTEANGVKIPNCLLKYTGFDTIS
jgi:seryl-tRNA synthetase